MAKVVVDCLFLWFRDECHGRVAKVVVELVMSWSSGYCRG